VPDFDLSAVLRRARRLADLSQRELARSCGIPVSVVSHAEAGRRGMSVELLARILAVAGLRLAVLDVDGCEVGGMAGEAVRDGAGRRYPAHLDTRHGDQQWWHGDERYSREQPWYTFDRVREWRDLRRERLGTPEDHQLPQPGDSPQERAAARRREAARRRSEEAQRRLAAGELQPTPEWVCVCPPGCDAAREALAEVHVEDCPCRCDVA
jgi:transcriptional regulator with XRE-family HTH domain